MDIEFWQSAGGKSEVREYLDNLEPISRKSFLSTLKIFLQIGLGESQKSEAVKFIYKDPPKIYELRPNGNRVLFHIKDEVCWFLVAFPKKFDKIKTRYINTAIKRAKSLYKNI